MSTKKDIINVKRMELYYADLSSDVIGSEQNGLRPVLILQNNIGNVHSPTTIVCSITSSGKKKILPTHVTIPIEYGLAKESVAMLEQIRTIDKSRLIRRVGKLHGEIVEDVEKKLMVSVGVKNYGIKRRNKVNGNS